MTDDLLSNFLFCFAGIRNIKP